MNILPLIVEQRRKGLFNKLVKRNKNVIIVELIGDGNRHVGYDVVVISTCPISRDYPGHSRAIEEGYTHVQVWPSSKTWGTYGWSVDTIQQAEKIFEEQVVLEEKRESKRKEKNG